MVPDGVVVRAVTELPEGIDLLLRSSLEEGHGLVSRLVDDWADGSNRFGGPGEVLLEARTRHVLAGVGGLNRDPYLDDPTVARVRHVYVAPDVRGQGIGRMIVETLVDHARTMRFARVRLRVGPREAAGFYTAIGFREVEEPGATHEMEL